MPEPRLWVITRQAGFSTASWMWPRMSRRTEARRKPWSQAVGDRWPRRPSEKRVGAKRQFEADRLTARRVDGERLLLGLGSDLIRPRRLFRRPFSVR